MIHSLSSLFSKFRDAARFFFNLFIFNFLSHFNKQTTNEGYWEDGRGRRGRRGRII